MVEKPKEKAPKARAKLPPMKTGSSTFLPSLMGGYISNSESEASDIDVAPPVKKNRRGQRARQAIWEKKYKENAKHVGQQKQGRDDGWDMKRGAVGDDDAGPWKKGVGNPLRRTGKPPRNPESSGSNAIELVRTRRDAPPPKPKVDDSGPLHPSWEAAKKAKETAQKIEFKGKKVVFD